ncbi:MAG: N-acetylmuramoyl-L-alanine amidase [Defluviitaleaceae bacterium]|nr:N-acetylmuramoyl-L-alanine amidase [Defluviitaleaceae bacterium]
MQMNIMNSPNQNVGRGGRRPDMIVLHNTGGTTQSAINTIMNPANQVSYHFIISPNGAITRFVHPDNTAWHAGTNNNGGSQDNSTSRIPEIRQRRINANLFTIGIAFGDIMTTRGNITNEAMLACVALIQNLKTQYQITHVIGHIDVVPRHRPDCPGTQFPWTRLNELLREDPRVIEELRRDMVNLQQRVETLEKFKAENTKRINTMNEVPEWAVPTIKKLIDRGALQGDGAGFNLSLEMIRLLVINDRIGLLGD